MNRISQKLKRRRYHLHWRVRKAGIKLNSKTRTVFQKADAPTPDNRWLKELLNKHGYQIQLTIEN